MDEMLQRLDALCRHPSLKVNPSQNATIIGDVVHSVMYPYFLKKSPEEQERLKVPVLAHLRVIADYCLHGYVENPEPRLTIAFIKGLHRVLYHNSSSIPVKAMDGSMTTMVPGEFKTTPVFLRRPSNPNEWFGTSDPEHVASELDMLLVQLHDAQAPLFQRYFRLMIDLTLIHPFPDSNGKLAMLLGDLFLLKQGIHPPYFAKCKWENEREIYDLAERYTLDPQRDISIFYPVLVRMYENLLVIQPSPDVSNNNRGS